MRVDTVEVARLLMDMNRQKLLAPFFAEPTTVSKAATQVGVKDVLMFRQVKRFAELGILSVVRVEKRQGRPLKYYQTAAQEFFIPASVFSLEQTLEQVERALQATFLHNLARTLHHNEPAGDLGTSLSLSSTGIRGVAVQLALAPGKLLNPEDLKHAAIVELWVMAQLNLEEAKALQKELANLTERYTKKDGTQKYLLRLGLTPVE